jgi:hypothetical protein
MYEAGWDNWAIIASRYELNDPGIESQEGVRFIALVQTGPGIHRTPCTVGLGHFSGGKASEAWSRPPISI